MAYTEAHKRATNRYRSDKSQIALTLTWEEKEMIQTKANKSGLSVKQYLVGLVENDK